ncbi:hypothetical protein ACRAWF_41220 [Streptomyces sp. L7]
MARAVELATLSDSGQVDQALGLAATTGRFADDDLVAVDHSIITALWHKLTDHVTYHWLGGTYFTTDNPRTSGCPPSPPGHQTATPFVPCGPLTADVLLARRLVKCQDVDD